MTIDKYIYIYDTRDWLVATSHNLNTKSSFANPQFCLSLKMSLLQCAYRHDSEIVFTNICIFIFEHYMFICIDSPDDPETRKKIFAAAPGCPNLLKGTEVVHFRSF